MSRLPLLPDNVSASFLPSGEYEGAPLMPARAETGIFFADLRCCTNTVETRRSNDTYASHSPSGDHAGDIRGSGELITRLRLAPSESATNSSYFWFGGLPSTEMYAMRVAKAPRTPMIFS